jgi:transcriptional regulator with XRE-family HTH domain
MHSAAMEIEAIGRRVRDLRTQKDLSQDELAAKAGIHRNTVGNLELGACESVSLKTLTGIATALGVDVGELTSSQAGEDGHHASVPTTEPAGPTTETDSPEVSR